MSGWPVPPPARGWRSPSPAWRSSVMSSCASVLLRVRDPGSSSRPRQLVPRAEGHGPKRRAPTSFPASTYPLERAGEAMADLFDAPMGEGTLAGLLPEAAGKLGRFMDEVATALKASPVVHADETSVRIGVGLGWVHDASNASVTSLAVHEKQGIEGIEAIGVLTDYSRTIVHDGLATYDTEELAAAAHAQCHVHLGRHLDALANHASQTPWARAMKGLLAEAKKESEDAGAAGLARVPDAIAEPIAKRYDEILEQGLI